MWAFTHTLAGKTFGLSPVHHSATDFDISVLQSAEVSEDHYVTFCFTDCIKRSNGDLRLRVQQIEIAEQVQVLTGAQYFLPSAKLS